MKQLPFCALALVFPFVGLSAATLDVDSRIDSVTVYQGVAKVTRTFEVNLPAGESQLRFSGLPSSVNQSFVQVGVTGGASLDLGVVSFTNEYKEGDHSQVLKDLEAKVRGIEARKASIEAEKRALNEFVGSRNALVGAINKGIGETGKAELYELSKTAYADAAQASKDAFLKTAALDEELRQVGEELSLAREAVAKQLGREESTCARYAVDSVSPGGVTKGSISYYVGSVSWAPSYIAKADTASGSVGVTYLCSVRQGTGEDWSNVSLSLETARPGAGAKPEEPDPIYISHYVPIPARAMMKANAAVEMMAAPLPAAGSAEDSVSLSSFRVEAVATMTGFRAVLNGRVSVPSGEGETSLPLATQSMPCEFRTEAVPVTAETAFLVAKLKNGFDLPMLAGEMQVIVDGSTNGSGRVEETLPGADLTLGLGVNQNVIVERKTVAEKGGQGGIFGGKRVETRSYINKLTNHMRVPAKIVVRDLIPISRDEKIVVEVKQPKNAKVDPEKGTFETELTLQPGASIELPTEYSVSYPSDWQVTNF